MIISRLFQNLGLPESLRKHMLRVAALAKEITDNWKDDSINRDHVIQACLLHDIAKSIEFDYDKPQSFLGPGETVEQLKKAQSLLIKKYGTEDHEAGNKICREIGVSERVIEINDKKSPFSKKIPQVAEMDDYEVKIVAYCDSRVTPFGITTIRERSEEYIRRKGLDPKKLDRDLDEFTKLLYKIETQIQDKTGTDLASIDSSEVEKKIEELANYNVGK